MASNTEYCAVHGPVVCAGVPFEGDMDLECQVDDHPQRDTEDTRDQAIHGGIVVELSEMRQTPIVAVQRLNALIAYAINIDFVHGPRQ